MEEGINLKKKIQLCREENSNKKLIRYPEALKREILDFLKEEKVSKFCKETKVTSSTINNWKKSYVSTVSHKKSLFKAVSLKKEKSCDEREGLSLKGSRLGRGFRVSEEFMIFLSEGYRIFVCSQKIDMRWSFERLSYLVRSEMEGEINLGDLYLFLGFNRKRLKGLFYDGSGLVLLTKRMEKERFMSLSDLSSPELTRSELNLLVHGSILRKYELKKR